MFSCTSDDDANLVRHAGCLCHRPEIQVLTRRVSTDLSRRGFVAGMAISIASLGLPRLANEQPVAAQPSRPILFTNFRLFDGKSGSLREGMRLLVEGNRIKAVITGNPAAPDGAQVIDSGGRTLMPGLIDAHWHSIFAGLPISTLLTADTGFIPLAARAEAPPTLMRGFTTVRDLGGPVFAFKQAIDQGLVSGPRIYPSGAMITSTGGRGGLRAVGGGGRWPWGPGGAGGRTGGARFGWSAGCVRWGWREPRFQGVWRVQAAGGGD